MLFDCQKLEKNIDGFFKDAIYCEIFKGLDEFLCSVYIYIQIHKEEQSIQTAAVSYFGKKCIKSNTLFFWVLHHNAFTFKCI